MALIPDDPRDQRKFLVVLALLAGAAGYYMYVYTPKETELQELRDRVAQIETQNDRARARMGNLDALRADVAEAERLFSALQRLVPSRAEVPDIYESIASETQSLGLDLQSVTPSQPSREGEQYYLTQTWDMTVQGDYHSIGQFLARVASFRRIVRPQVSSIQPAGEAPTGERRATASFQLQTFVLPPDSLKQAPQETDASTD